MARLTGKELGLTSVRGYLLVTKEIAKFLRRSERWVEMHMNDGTFPFRWYSIGDRLRAADSADFDDWLRKIVREAGTAPLPLKAAKKLKKEKEVNVL